MEQQYNSNHMVYLLIYQLMEKGFTDETTRTGRQARAKEGHDGRENIYITK